MSQFIEFVINRWDLFLTLLLILLLLSGGHIMRRLRGYKEVEISQAVTMLNHDDAVILDVREEKEFREGHILNAIHIPLGKLDKQLGELEQYKGRDVIIHCRSGHRSASACGRLRKQGFEKVYNLKGGILAWQNANLPLQKPGKSKKRKDK